MALGIRNSLCFMRKCSWSWRLVMEFPLVSDHICISNSFLVNLLGKVQYIFLCGISIKQIVLNVTGFRNWKALCSPLLLSLSLYIWRKLQYGSNLGSFSSSDLEIERVGNTIFQCTAAYIMYVQHMLRSFSKHLH